VDRRSNFANNFMDIINNKAVITHKFNAFSFTLMFLIAPVTFAILFVYLYFSDCPI